MSAGYLAESFYADREHEVRREWTADEHRAMSRTLLAPRYGSATTDALLAAQVHATLALSLETAKATQAEVRPHTHGSVR